MKNKTAIIAIVVLLALLGIGGGYFLFAQKSAPKQDSQIPQQQDQAIPTLSPDAIGLTMALSTVGKNAGHSVNVTIGKISDISAIDYELSYNADNPTDPTQKVPRGAIGHFDIKPSDSSIHQEIVLGTCSDVCHYDKNVTDVKLVLKITKKDSKNYQTTATLNP